jgi:hypothetical protein
MASLEPRIVRSESPELVVQTLPDGSTAIFDAATKNVYSLNPSAAAAWEGCGSATTLSELASAMSRRLSAPVTEELAHEAVSELSAAGLVTVSHAERFGTSRRDLIKQVAGVAIPVVLVLTGAQQRAHAQTAGSTPPPTTPFPTTTSSPTTTTAGPTTTPPPGSTTTAPPGGPFQTFTIIKGTINFVGDTPVPLQGAMFNILNSSNVVVVQMVTDQNGLAAALLPAGSYTLVETFAPGGPYVPFPPTPFVIPPGQDINRNRENLRVAG